MPGAYAHLTLVNEVSVPERLEAANIPQDAIIAVLDYKKYVELGAVSPDLPYLKPEIPFLKYVYPAYGDAKAWADLMHYKATSSVIKAAAQHIRHETDEERRRKKLAWLLG